MRAMVIGLAAAAAALVAVPVFAQLQAQGAPAGSYQRSCRNIQTTGGTAQQATLSAECRDAAGRYRTSTLFYRQCRGDIGNNNGTLACSGAPAATPGRPQPPRLPDGSWRESCTNGQVGETTLRAQCRDRSGRMRAAEANWRQCRGNSFSNVDGRLVCDADLPQGRGGRGRGAELPGGSWADTCIDRRIEGAFVRGRCMNNRGVRVIAEARWADCPSYAFYNQNGQLFCERDDGRGRGRGRGQAQEPVMPGGPWRETCVNPRMVSAFVFEASCQDRRTGRFRQTSIDVRSCRSNSVANNQGTLVCN